MAHWNHRLVEVDDGDGDKLLLVCEVYYNDDGKPWSRTENASGATGANVDEVRLQLERMLKCLDRPILTDDDFVKDDKGW